MNEYFTGYLHSYAIHVGVLMTAIILIRIKNDSDKGIVSEIGKAIPYALFIALFSSFAHNHYVNFLQ